MNEPRVIGVTTSDDGVWQVQNAIDGYSEVWLAGDSVLVLSTTNLPVLAATLARAWEIHQMEEQHK